MSRYVYDTVTAFFILILIGGIFLGIIIDSFAQLREKKAKVIEDKNTVCFICGETKNDIDQKGSVRQDFRHHVRYKHHLWDYLFFIATIRSKDPNDF